jgi:hypothetical protein
MKRRFGIVLIFTVIYMIIVSFSIPNRDNYTNNKVLNNSKSDTTTNNSWIKIDTFDLEIIPPSSGVKFYRDGIIYLSSSKFEGKMLNNHISFGKPGAQYALINAGSLIFFKEFSPTSPFTFPCEAVSFNSDFNTMYYTKYSEADGLEKIFEAKFTSETDDKGYWTFNENPLNFCTDKNIYTHPALSSDGKLMVFASNRQGSIGGMDLFVSQEKNGIWSEPLNLGDAVNSSANEFYPYLDPENNLYFSSDGFEGFGGYDIYVCKFKSNTWEKPINLSTPVNTQFDDVAFTINRKDGKSGFYTVKQSEGKKSVQLRKVEMNNSIPDTLLNLSQYFTRPDISHMVILALEPAVQATDIKTEQVEQASGMEETIIYRVQFGTSFNPRTRTTLTIESKDYSVFEYLYSGAYRLFIGEFNTLASAVELQNLLKKNDYPRASVVAFKNGVLSLDPELLRETSGSTPKEATSKPVNAESIIQEKQKETATVALNQETKVPVPTENEKVMPVMVAGSATATSSAAKKTDTTKTDSQVNETGKDEVVYRIQIVTNSKPKGSYEIIIAGKTYKTFEYQYAGAYRSTVGEFNTLSAASDFQRTVRQSGYPQAFVVAFVNNKRSTDPSLFK